jgi:hypothetical protein
MERKKNEGTNEGQRTQKDIKKHCNLCIASFIPNHVTHDDDCFWNVTPCSMVKGSNLITAVRISNLTLFIIFTRINEATLSKGCHLDVVRGPSTPHDPESDAGGSLSSWQGHPSR